MPYIALNRLCDFLHTKSEYYSTFLKLTQNAVKAIEAAEYEELNAILDKRQSLIESIKSVDESIKSCLESFDSEAASQINAALSGDPASEAKYPEIYKISTLINSISRTIQEDNKMLGLLAQSGLQDAKKSLLKLKTANKLSAYNQNRDMSGILLDKYR